MNEVPIPLGDLERIEAGEAGRVVHQTVQAAEAFAHLAEHVFDLRYALQVRLEQFRPACLFGGAPRFRFGRTEMDRHSCALFRQAKGDGPSDPLGRARHQNRFAAQVVCHVLPLIE